MKFKLFAVLMVGVLLFAVCGSAAEVNWLTDYNKALALAKKENKKVLIHFTGSTWCPPCIQMHKDVFSKQQFIDYANKKIVPVLVDLPRAEVPSDEQVKLLQKYDPEGMVPTYVILDSAGKQLDLRRGYQAGGPEAFVDWVEKAK